MTTTIPTKPMFAMNGSRDTVTNPALLQIVDAVTNMLENANEPFRVRTSRYEDSEVVKITTLNTDHQMRFSVLRTRPCNVHLRLMVFKTVEVSNTQAGWTAPVITDFKTEESGHLGLGTLATINQQAGRWLRLNSENARRSRQRYLCVDGVDKPLNSNYAATFMVESIRINAGADFTIDLLNETQGCKARLETESAVRFNSPGSIVGKRAIVHHDKVVRILRPSIFNNLYELTDERAVK